MRTHLTKLLPQWIRPRQLHTSIHLTEVSPRDGLQNEPTTLPLEVKHRLIANLSETGLPTIEAGAFVNPKLVPQMRDTPALLTTLPIRPGTKYQWLVPNAKAMEEFNALCKERGEHSLAFLLSASETFSRRNTNCSIGESMERLRGSLGVSEGRWRRVYVSTAFDCPYEGVVGVGRVALLVEEVLGLQGVDEVVISDTTGSATPVRVGGMLREVGRFEKKRVGWHFHDTNSMAKDCVVRCLEEGYTRFDASVGGLGGCPFSPGATGNVATEDLVELMHGLGLKTGVDGARLKEVGRDYFIKTTVARNQVVKMLDMGYWKPNVIAQLYYGSGCVKKHLLDCLPSDKSRAFIVTTSSIAKTDLIGQVEGLLDQRHAGTFDHIGQFVPIAQLDEATGKVAEDPAIDTLVSLGGGSPIDCAKTISYRFHEISGRWLHHIAIPTTLSAAECTSGAGHMDANGRKTRVADPQLAPNAVLYDSSFTLHTPIWLMLSSAMRSVDHAIELMYHPTATEMPCRWMTLQAAGELFKYLPRYKEDPKDEDVITHLQLATFASLGFLGLNTKGGLGLSHSLGYALGSPYGIPHGITSCLTLGHVVKLKAQNPADAAQIARVAPFIGIAPTGDDKKDAVAVGQAVLDLVERLGLKTTLTERGVGKDQVDTIVNAAGGDAESFPGSFGRSKIPRSVHPSDTRVRVHKRRTGRMAEPRLPAFKRGDDPAVAEPSIPRGPRRRTMLIEPIKRQGRRAAEAKSIPTQHKAGWDWSPATRAGNRRWRHPAAKAAGRYSV
ncbi:Dehydroquinate synthase-like protein [Piedraia hortae CBS 480.64]|uniref:hydroxymethylglutaryl-CoA lyase n=1 Tax=Piedraia hortae CBS 480.64 TaxID=1314780 RepID=A0A6A7CB75_9PEZI|nr:Dehydroquinate synthase-like protein [Piedraia hortae CBS 480.64]